MNLTSNCCPILEVKRKKASADPSDASSGAEPSKRGRETPEGRVLRPRSQAPSPGLLTTPVLVVIPFMRNNRRLMFRLNRMLTVIKLTPDLAELVVRS